MNNKYLAMIGGRLKQVLAVVTSVGAADAGKLPALDGTGRLSGSVMPTGFGADTANIVASEALSSGDIVHVWDDAGTPKVRKADASAEGKEAVGFVKDSAASGDGVAVYFEGINPSLSGLTVGPPYYLSASTPGAVTTTAPTASGAVVVGVGNAISSTELSFEPGAPVTLA